MNRRMFLSRCCGAFAGSSAAKFAAPGLLRAAESEDFSLRYILASSMYGRLPLADVLPEVKKTGAEAIDVWPERHANHREQIEELGHEKFAAMLEEHGVRVGIYTCYNPGLLKMQPWMRVCKKFGGSMVISNSGGLANLEGARLEAEIGKLAERLKPHVEAAASLGVTIGVENHSGSLVNSPESQKRLLDAIPSKHVGIALAPYHLPQDPQLLAGLIGDLGERLVHFYAWEHGMGCMKKLPKKQELMQMPGRGPLDFAPLVAALKKIGYRGWTSIFMHPVPRGIPILPTAEEVTAEINRSREYLAGCLGKA